VQVVAVLAAHLAAQVRAALEQVDCAVVDLRRTDEGAGRSLRTQQSLPAARHVLRAAPWLLTMASSPSASYMPQLSQITLNAPRRTPCWPRSPQWARRWPRPKSRSGRGRWSAGRWRARDTPAARSRRRRRWRPRRGPAREGKRRVTIDLDMRKAGPAVPMQKTRGPRRSRTDLGCGRWSHRRPLRRLPAAARSAAPASPPPLGRLAGGKEAARPWRRPVRSRQRGGWRPRHRVWAATSVAKDACGQRGTMDERLTLGSRRASTANCWATTRLLISPGSTGSTTVKPRTRPA
jgi:hypothetical protein